MGVKGLRKFIDVNAPESVRPLSLSYFSGKRLSIDTSVFLHRTWNACFDSRRLVYHTLELARWLRSFAIVPVFVFEGVPLATKQTTVAKRNRQSARKQKPKLRHWHVQQCRQALELAGNIVLEARHEAEATCAWLARSGLVAAAISEDMDTLAFGTPLLLTKLHTYKETVISYNLAKLLRALKVSREQFIRFCVELGTDFSTTNKRRRKNALKTARDSTQHAVDRPEVYAPRTRTHALALYLYTPSIDPHKWQRALAATVRTEELDMLLRTIN
jgi:flap endonuclease-1